MDFIWILVAFAFGFLVKQLTMPPLVGFLIAGFVLNAFAVEPLESLDALANIGITLLLFTIGLKIRLRDLLTTELLVGSLGHMCIWLLCIPICLWLLGITGLAMLTDLTGQQLALISFALSFSSTVCIAKILEDKGELKTRHGKLSIAVLVIQDIVAVIFLVIALGELPSIWALALFLLIPAGPLLGRLLNQAGHGELLPLLGFFLAFGAYELFSLVNIKGDLGALLLGMLLSSHSKSAELYKALMGFKDIFLIGFFLKIGFYALPTMETFFMALSLLPLLFLKLVLFFFLFTWLRLRSRTAFLSSLLLANFSEFGLIVCALSVEKGWLDPSWLIAIAMAVAMSFMLLSVVYSYAHSLFARYKTSLLKWQRDDIKNPACPNMPTGAEVLVIGMGRVGSASYDAMAQKLGDVVWGVDADSYRIESHRQTSRKVALADAEDIEFWEQLDLSGVKLVMLALPSVDDMKSVIQQIKACSYTGRIAAVSRYTDEGDELLSVGADTVFSYYREVGAGFADESLQLINS